MSAPIPTPDDDLRATLDRVRADLRSALQCSLCGGSGQPVAGQPCDCGGSGRAVDEIHGLREACNRAQADLAHLRTEAASHRAMFAMFEKLVAETAAERDLALRFEARWREEARTWRARVDLQHDSLVQLMIERDQARGERDLAQRMIAGGAGGGAA